MFRRRLRFMLDGYMLANNIERPRDRGEPSTSSTESGQRKARSPVHPRIPASRQLRVFLRLLVFHHLLALLMSLPSLML
jgi:hypothetical protein